MQWYLLDDTLKRDSVIEGFQSFIWTERYNSWGDFEMIIESTQETRQRFKPGLMLAMEESDRVMLLESVQDDTADDGTRNLTVTGRSIEAWLDDRVAYSSISDLTTTPKWTIGPDTPGNIARTIFTHICVDHSLNANDVIPFYATSPIVVPPLGLIPEPTDSVTMDFDPATVYADISTICQQYNMGFALYRDGDSGDIYFAIYMGFDRTSGNPYNEGVTFSSGLESLAKTSVLTSVAGYKNVAYVLAQHGTAVVYGANTSSSTAPIDRKVLYVDASDVDTAAGFALDAALALRGKQALLENQRTYALDGEVTANQPYVYGRDYFLGDMVEERSDDGFVNDMLVTEQIFISDDQGERSYPTLTVSTFATAGSWDAVIPTEFWNDVDPGTYWADE